MKIEWLNDEMTEAIVTRGWWLWKRQAHIRRISHEEWLNQSHSNRWRFIPSDRPFPYAIEHERDVETRRRAESSDWQPVRPMPAARLVERKP